jgi:hypothetical protein
MEASLKTTFVDSDGDGSGDGYLYYKINGIATSPIVADLVVEGTLSGLRVGDNLIEVWTISLDHDHRWQENLSVRILEVELYAYPNPTSGPVTIQLPEMTPSGGRLQPEEFEVFVSNSLGVIVTEVFTPEDFKTQVDLYALPAGMYNVTLRNKRTGHQSGFRIVKASARA